MKFDAVVGNPPYQESRQDTRDDAIYNYFYDLAEKLCTKYCLISPARFLFNAGSTDKNWNQKMLSDEHLKVIYFNQKSSEVFPDTDIKGGIAILYRDEMKVFGKIGAFTSFKELNSIIPKVENKMSLPLSSIMTGQGIYRFTQEAHDDFPVISSILPKSHQFDISTGVFSTLYNILFFKDRPKDNYSYTQLLGRHKNQRIYLWIRTKYINTPPGFDKWRVILPNANGSGILGETLSSPLVGKPYIGFTQTFISIGTFDHKIEAENALKYIKTKFARIMLGVLKITQHNPRDKWQKVPLQDFTPESDIDWSKSVAEIDQQLYQKYGLDQDEIDFIEKQAVAME